MAVLGSRLEAWTKAAGAGERRTVVVRARTSTDPARAVRDIEAAGARVESAGRDVITVVADALSLQAVAALPWVTAIEEPRAMHTKAPRS